jgi:hypothetical protein
MQYYQLTTEEKKAHNVLFCNTMRDFLKTDGPGTESWAANRIMEGVELREYANEVRETIEFYHHKAGIPVTPSLMSAWKVSVPHPNFNEETYRLLIEHAITEATATLANTESQLVTDLTLIHLMELNRYSNDRLRWAIDYNHAQFLLVKLIHFVNKLGKEGKLDAMFAEKFLHIYCTATTPELFVSRLHVCIRSFTPIQESQDGK